MKLTDEAITEAYKSWLKSGAGYIEYARAIESAISPPVAAGSVDTMQRYEEGGEFVKYADAIAWCAQQREAGRQEGRRDAHETNIVVLGDCLKAESRVKELEAALAKAYPNAIDPSNTPC